MYRKFLPIIISSGLLLLSSCKTYYISRDSLKEQFTGIDSSKFNNVKMVGPIGDIYRYPANPITTIKCVDKKGNQMGLENGPSIEIRITHGYKKRRTVFYFDRIYVSETAVTGVESRFMQSIRKTIPLDSITKIEVQDGHKNFHYAENQHH